MRKSATPSPVICVQRPRLRWVSCAEAGREASAASVMRVWDTSRWVSWVKRGRRVSKADRGRVKHSCRLMRLMPIMVDGDSLSVAMVEANASMNGCEDDAQRSSPRSLGRSKNILWRTLASMSSSRFSCSRTSWIHGARSRHFRRVFGVRFWISELVWRERPRPTEVKCERSSLRMRDPRPGYSDIWVMNLEKIDECGTVICR